MKMMRLLRLLTWVVLFDAVIVFAQDGGSFGWQYTPQNQPNVRGNQPAPVRRGDAMSDMPNRAKPRPIGEQRPMSDSPAYHQDNFFGMPTRMDPLFSEEKKPSWQFGVVNEPDYHRPDWDKPDYEGPIFRQDPIEKPAYNRPSYSAPAEDKPRYIYDYERAPAARLPFAREPVVRAPNYNDRTYSAEAYDRPEYSRSEIYANRPEYNEPNYRVDEYRAPREEAVPYLKPE
jgi:hypothetical protein